MIKKLAFFSLRALICAAIGIFSVLILMASILVFIHAGDISLDKKIQGDYSLSIFTIDHTYIFATVHRSDESADGRESIRRIGVFGRDIYWESYSDTLYRIDTEAQVQERIHTLPADVELLDPISFWNALHCLPR